MDKVSVPETLNALRLAVNAAESKIITYISCTNCRGDDIVDAATEPYSTMSGSRPMVAKFLRSKSDDTTKKQDVFKVDIKELGLNDQNDSKLFERPPISRGGSSAGSIAARKQGMGEGFVPAWRRKSLDDINRIRCEKRGKSVDNLHAIEIAVNK